MDFSKHTFRCSSLAYIMSNPKGKSPMQKYLECKQWLEDNIVKYDGMKKELKTAKDLLTKIQDKSLKLKQLEQHKDDLFLSSTCKTHLADVYTRVKYGRTEDIKSKYLEKGLKLEEDAITAYCISIGEFRQKNVERKYNQWIEGESDIEDEISITDTKINWSIFQFNRVVTKPLIPLYEWQIRGYMMLWEKPIGRVAYVLLNTPENLLQREFNKIRYEMFGNQQNFDLSSDEDKALYQQACDEIRFNHTYDDIPDEDKIRVFTKQRDLQLEECIKIRVEECRKYLQLIDSGVLQEDEAEIEEMEDAS